MFRQLHRLALIAAASLAASCSTTTPEALEPPAGVTGDIDSYLDAMERFGFSGAAGVRAGDEIVVARGLGAANLDTGAAFTTETGFFIASVTKQMTAAMILALEDRGVLSTNDSIADHLDGVPAARSGVKIRHLLSHTSGLAQLRETPDTSYATSAALAAAALAEDPASAPGERFDYSNTGYGVLVAVAEAATGESYETLMRTLLFEPAGMTSTTIVTERGAWEGRPLATGYNGRLAQGDALLVRPYSRQLIGPAGVVTTLSDMLRWEQALRDGAVLSDAATAKLFTPVLDHYAFGWGVWDSGRAGQRVAGHDGFILPEGMNTYYLRLLDDDAAVIVFAARGDFAMAEPAAWAVADILTGRAPPALPAVGGAAAAPEAGLYESATGARLAVHDDGGRLSLEVLNQAAADLFLDEPDKGAEVAAFVGAGLQAPEGELANTLEAARRGGASLGAHLGDEVVYGYQADGFARAHLRHRFERGSVFTRVDVVDGAVVGGTDAGAFITGGRGLGPALSWIGFAPAPNGGWTAFDFESRRAVAAEVTKDGLVVGGVRFRRVGNAD